MDQSTTLPIVPNYISNPVFPYNDSIIKQCQSTTTSSSSPVKSLNSAAVTCGDLSSEHGMSSIENISTSWRLRVFSFGFQ